jgi:hypothetical protein
VVYLVWKVEHEEEHCLLSKMKLSRRASSLFLVKVAEERVRAITLFLWKRKSRLVERVVKEQPDIRYSC